MNYLKENRGSALQWLIIGIVGILMIFGQQWLKDTAYRIIALLLGFSAVTSFLNWWKLRNVSGHAIPQMLSSVLLLFIAIWIFSHPRGMDTILNITIGVLMILFGIGWFLRGYEQADGRMIQILAVIAVVIGLVIALTNAATSWLIIAEGISLVYAAVVGYLTDVVSR